MERVVSTEILRYCKRHGLISEQQHRCLPKRSTETNLLSGHNDYGQVLFLTATLLPLRIDFQKAFDSVIKSYLHDSDRWVLQVICWPGGWIKNFITDQQQCTRVGDVVSDTVKIISGVIQGSCLGPVLFDISIALPRCCLMVLYVHGNICRGMPGIFPVAGFPLPLH